MALGLKGTAGDDPATLSAVSQGLGAERLRTTIIILAGTAVTQISAAVWLMTNTLAFG